ncbi:MAG TPA: TlpA disulfide reductase family protein [Pirellulales bacterium]|nr:TlpA disulfide reductase family protein [Pirellulales bacterium]
MDATYSPGASEGRSRAWTWTSLAVLAAIVFAYLALVGRGRTASGTQGPAIGRKLSYLELQPLTGDASWISLRDLAGHVTLVNYWGTWCPPCRAEFPHIVELTSKFAGQHDFRLLAVSCGGEGSDDTLDELREETQAFLKSKNVTLPTYADQHAASRRELARSLQLEFGYPTSLILDRQGIIRGFWEGYISGSEVEMSDLVQQLLNEPAGRLDVP